MPSTTRAALNTAVETLGDARKAAEFTLVATLPDEPLSVAIVYHITAANDAGETLLGAEITVTLSSMPFGNCPSAHTDLSAKRSKIQSLSPTGMRLPARG